MKKIIILMALVLFGVVAMAQPPKPGEGGTAPDTGNSVNNAPIGTATLLLLGLGGAYTGYRVLSRKSEE